jgi:hypothetical protein
LVEPYRVETYGWGVIILFRRSICSLIDAFILDGLNSFFSSLAASLYVCCCYFDLLCLAYFLASHPSVLSVCSLRSHTVHGSVLRPLDLPMSPSLVASLSPHGKGSSLSLILSLTHSRSSSYRLLFFFHCVCCFFPFVSSPTAWRLSLLLFSWLWALC